MELSGPRNITDSVGIVWLVVESPRSFDGSTGQKMLDAIKELVEGGVVYFAFDMTETQVVNSVGVSRLIEAIELCDEHAGGIVFCTTRPILVKTFKIMGLLLKARLVDQVADVAGLD